MRCHSMPYSMPAMVDHASDDVMHQSGFAKYPPPFEHSTGMQC